MKPPIDASALLFWLGHSPAEAAFDAFLEQNRIFDRPHTAQQDGAYDEDPGEAFENARASEIDEVERDSICLIYEARGNYERLFGPARSDGEFVLKQVAFYAPDVQSYPGYRGTLPFGIVFSDDRETIRAKLGTPTASRRIHDLASDLYVGAAQVINLSYLDDGRSVGIVHVRAPHLYDRRMVGIDPAGHDPAGSDLRSLIGYLGGSAYEPSLEALLAPLGWRSSHFAMADCDEVPNLIGRHGIALYYRNARDYPALSAASFARDRAVFAGFRLNRRGDMNSDGYGGQLPCGIEFHYTPEQAIACVGRTPDWESIGEDVGAFKWKQPDHILHVMFSLIDYQVYRVACFATFMESELFKRRS